MFYNTALQEKQDFEDWDTSKVTDMSYMFCNTSLQERPNLGNWDTSNVTNMMWMFWNCNLEVTSDFVNNWDMSNVENTAGMFSRCTMKGSFSLTTPITNVKNTNSMFSLLKLVKTTEDEEIYFELKNIDTSKTTDMQGMFSSIQADHIYVEGLSFESCTSAQSLFYASSVKTITIRDWHSIGDTPIYNMIYGCLDITDIYIIDVPAEDFKKIVEAIPVDRWSPHVITTVHCQSSVYYQVFDDSTNIYRVTFAFDIP
jgi:surface protein